MRQSFAIAAVLLAAATLQAAPPTTCKQTDDYSRALCAYQRRNFAEAERLFGELADEKVSSPQTVRALYFLGRTEMKLGRYDEASTRFIRIYSLDKPFYHAWNCDFLLGECRKASGKG
jgi:TolA-binding protein